MDLPDELRCDCGERIAFRVPVDQNVADVYGISTGGSKDMCRACFYDILQSGDVARVLSEVEPLTEGARNEMAFIR